MAYWFHQYLSSTCVLCAPVPGSGILMGFLAGLGTLSLSELLVNVKFHTRGSFSPLLPGLQLCSCSPPLGAFFCPFHTQLWLRSECTEPGCVQRPMMYPNPLFSPLTTLVVRDGSSPKGKLRLVTEEGRFEVRIQVLTSFVVLSCLEVLTKYLSPSPEPWMTG